MMEITMDSTAVLYEHYDAALYPGLMSTGFIEKEKTGSVQLTLAPQSRIKIITHNIAVANSTDYISVTLVKGLYTQTVHYVIGAVDPASFDYHYFISDGTVLVNWTVNNELGSNSFSDTINVLPFAKTTYSITY